MTRPAAVRGFERMRGRQCLLAIVPVVLAACGGGHGVADRFSGA
jgi:hypothetical protein